MKWPENVSRCQTVIINTTLTHSHSRDNIASILYQLIEIRQFLASLKLFQEMSFQMREFVTDAHVCQLSRQHNNATYVDFHIYCIAGTFRGFYFCYGEPKTENQPTKIYYDDVLRAFNENKTTKIHFQGLITKILPNENFPQRCVVKITLHTMIFRYRLL